MIQPLEIKSKGEPGRGGANLVNILKHCQKKGRRGYGRAGGRGGDKC